MQRHRRPHDARILRLHQALQPHKDKPINEAIDAIAQDYWNGPLRPLVEQQLRQLTKAPQPAAGKL